MRNNKDYPLWETAAMIASFVFLWVWLVAQKNAQATGQHLGPLWTVAQLAAAALLIVVFFRRAKRVGSSMRGDKTVSRNDSQAPRAKKSKGS